MTTRPVYGEYDAVVSGGGLAGLACALKLAQQGKRVGLVERRSVLGWEVVRARRVIADLTRLGAAEPRLALLLDVMKERPLWEGNTIYAPYAELLFDRWAAEAGVDLLLHGWSVGLMEQDGLVEGLIAGTREGYQELRAEVVIETGDAARLVQGQPELLEVALSGVRRAVLVTGGETQDGPGEVLLPSGRRAELRLLIEGRGLLDIDLQEKTVANRDLEYHGAVIEALTYLRSSVPGCENLKSMFMAEEEWKQPNVLLSTPTGGSTVGYLLTEGSEGLKSVAINTQALTAQGMRGLYMGGAWLSLFQEASTTEELQVWNRWLIGEAAAGAIQQASIVQASQSEVVN
ncbi:FAD-dependent oxidoreductase [Paenibacillus sp. GCM10023252]|uniref:FAD-dependent oxidoreductase n=1 Tax=Paenibacillus sp. GCM10023252 TaxID=3252649 RepID=UPI003621B460